MSSAKEREILERQRLLASQLKPAVGVGVASTGSSSSSSVPVQKRRSAQVKNKNPISKPPRDSFQTTGEEEEDYVSSLQRQSSAPAKNQNQPPPQQQRPSLKRPASTKSSAAIIAAARLQAASGNRSSTAASAALHPDEAKPSPKVQRKNLSKPSSSSTGGNSSSLASLMKHVVGKDGTNNSNDDDDTSLFQTHHPDDFWKNLRDWDLPSQYYHESKLQQQQSREKRGSCSAAAPTNPISSSFPMRKPIPETFLNARHYVSAWAPLCMSECRSQLLQEVTTTTTQNRMAPILVEVQSTGSRARYRRNGGGDGTNYHNDAPWMEENETGGYVIVNPKKRENLRFFPNDIVLLIQPRYKDILRDIGNGSAVPPDGSDLDSATVFGGISFIGHTESSRNELNGLILKVSKRKWTVIGKNEMYFVKIGSNVTALREFTALCSVDTLPMKRFLLGQHLEKAENRRKLSRNQPIDQLLHQMGGEQLGEGFLKYAKDKFNLSQLTAIAASAHEYGEGGFTLIKGPPGTGSKSRSGYVRHDFSLLQQCHRPSRPPCPQKQRRL